MFQGVAIFDENNQKRMNLDISSEQCQEIKRILDNIKYVQTMLIGTDRGYSYLIHSKDNWKYVTKTFDQYSEASRFLRDIASRKRSKKEWVMLYGLYMRKKEESPMLTIPDIRLENLDGYVPEGHTVILGNNENQDKDNTQNQNVSSPRYSRIKVIILCISFTVILGLIFGLSFIALSQGSFQ